MIVLLVIAGVVGLLVGAIIGRLYERMQWQSWLLSRSALRADAHQKFSEQANQRNIDKSLPPKTIQ